MVLDPAHRPARLGAFLREHGVTRRDDRVLTVHNGRKRTDVRAAFTLKAEPNKGLEGSSTTFEGGTASLKVQEGSELLLNRKIYALSLIQSAPDYWGESKYRDESALPAFNEKEDAPAPLDLAAAVIKGRASDSPDLPLQGKNAASRLIVINNSAFLRPANLREEQTDFVRNSVNWLVGRPGLAGVGPRGLRLYKLNLVEPQVAFLNRLNLFLIPALLLAIALLTWSLRRA